MRGKKNIVKMQIRDYLKLIKTVSELNLIILPLNCKNMFAYAFYLHPNTTSKITWKNKKHFKQLLFFCEIQLPSSYTHESMKMDFLNSVRNKELIKRYKIPKKWDIS